ncbi:hypothetical protein D3C87_1383820 [compost metagenome]
MLGEVLDHVVAFGFTVHQHVEAQAFLDLHGVTNFMVHGVGVVVRRQLALLVRLTRQTDRTGLRERADGGGRESRQFETCALLFDAFGKR